MIKTLGHRICSSLKEYVDYRLLKDLRAFTNRTVNLYQYSDDVYNTKTVYGSPYASWAYNTGVSGIATTSGVSGSGVSGQFYPRGSGASGVSIDYKNGRVMFNSGNSGLNLQAIVSVPEINTYVTTLPEAKLIGQTNFALQPTVKTANTYLPPYSAVLPALFFRIVHTENEVAAFSGADWTDYNIRVTALVINNEQLVAISDLIRDLSERNVPLLTTSVLNELNDLKSTSWDYNSVLNNPSDYFFIEESYINFIENDQFTARNPNLYVGLGTIKLRIFRFPRVEFP